MKGHLRRRGPTTWQALIYTGLVDGKRKYASRTIHAKTQKAADKLFRALMSTWGEEEQPDVSGLLETHLATWLAAKRGVRDSTLVHYEAQARQILAALGNVPVDSIDWKAALDTLSARYAPSTVQVLRTSLGQAFPASKRVKGGKRQATVLSVPTAQEVRELLCRLEGHRLQVAVALLYFCGLRRGELLGLQWRDVQPDRLRIERQRVYARRRVYDSTPKTPRSARVIPLSSMVLPYLAAERTRQDAEEVLWGREWAGGLYVCQAPSGAPWSPPAWDQAFLREVGPAIRPHSLRHAFAAHVLEAGGNLKALSQLMGHATVAFTLDTYGSFASDDSQVAAVEGLGRRFGALIDGGKAERKKKPEN